MGFEEGGEEVLLIGSLGFVPGPTPFNIFIKDMEKNKIK